jgi:glycosyltransferase involved in cell wall biosynthesis
MSPIDHANDSGTLEKLAVVLPSLDSGGLERVQLHLVQEWVARGIQVEIVVGRSGGPLREEVPPGVPVIEIAPRHPFQFPFGLLRYLRTGRPTHVLSATNDINVMTLLIAKLLGNQARVVLSIHSHLSSQLAGSVGLSRVKAKIVLWLLKLNIHRAHALIAVSNGVADDFGNWFPKLKGRLHVVYNPVIAPKLHRLMTQPLINCPVPNNEPWILFVGRFVHAKGIDILLDAFERIAGSTSAHLVLVGDGPLKPNFATAETVTKLRERIHFVGFQANPLPWMRQAQVLVLPSRHEGLGNVLIEAMACGTQVIAADCPSGPAEILENGRYGQLVPARDSEQLAKAILNTLTNSYHVSPDLLRGRAECFSSGTSANAYLEIIVANSINDAAARHIR